MPELSDSTKPAEPFNFQKSLPPNSAAVIEEYARKWFFGEKGKEAIIFYLHEVFRYKGEGFIFDDSMRALDYGVQASLADSTIEIEFRGDPALEGDAGVPSRCAYWMACYTLRMPPPLMYCD